VERLPRKQQAAGAKPARGSNTEVQRVGYWCVVVVTTFFIMRHCRSLLWVVCVKRKSSTALSKRNQGIGTLEKFHSKGDSLTPVNSELKSYTLSTDLVDFNARLVGSANPAKYDIAVYSNKGKAIVHEPDVL
jgi:hypothetical protein